MTCTEFELLLDQREPDAQTEAALQRHAEECAHCRMLLELRTLDRDEQVPEAISAQWRAAIRTEQARAESTRRSRGFFQARVLAPICAVAAVLVAAVALRGSLTDAKPKKAMTLSTPVEEYAESEEAVESPVLALGAVAATSAPTIRLAATSLPTTGNAMFSMSARKSQAQEDTAPAENVLPEFDAELTEEAYYEAEESTDEGMALSDISADARNDALDGFPDTVRLAWSAERPVETAKRLLEILNLPESAIETSGKTSVEIHLGIKAEEWEKLMAALQDTGCDVLPAYDEMPWDESGETRFLLQIDEKEYTK